MQTSPQVSITFALQAQEWKKAPLLPKQNPGHLGMLPNPSDLPL